MDLGHCAMPKVHFVVFKTNSEKNLTETGAQTQTQRNKLTQTNSQSKFTFILLSPKYKVLGQNVQSK